MHLQRATILITGAASGLGAACLEHFSAQGALVVGFDQRWASVSAGSENVRHISGDVASEEDVRRAITEAITAFGQLNGVVNCAGILRAGRAVSRSGPYPLADFAEVVRVNLIGTFNVMRLAAEAMMNNTASGDDERGVIVNTSSVAAFDGQIGQAAYSASKGGVASMTLPLARELGSYGIRVVAIAPGVFDTPMMQGTPERVQQSLLEQIPFPHRFGKPAEFAALAEHVFRNPMLNGAVLRLDGAIRMGGK